MPYRIYRLAPEESGDWHHLFAEALAEYPDCYGYTVEEWQAQSFTSLQNRLAAETVIGARDEANQLCAVLACARHPLQKLASRGQLYGAYVAKAHRRTGVMRALLETVEQEVCGMHPLLRVSIVTENHPAMRCFMQAGYTELSVDPFMMQSNGQWVAGTTLQKQL